LANEGTDERRKGRGVTRYASIGNGKGNKLHSRGFTQRWFIAEAQLPHLLRLQQRHHDVYPRAAEPRYFIRQPLTISRARHDGEPDVLDLA
jgi:hypothetical protein